MRICTKCKKREGSWWDHLCKYCRNIPTSEKEALEYKKVNDFKDVISPEQIKSSSMTNVEEKKYNKSAIIGLVLSIIAVFGVGLAGIAGFILGIVGLVQIKHTHEKGKGLAIAAIIVGFIWSFIVGILRRLVEAGF
ncbi:MAG: DUF4190 domain-containing protein [Candidatus Yonathbacteria bacterium]|nr:DUF4190 domain-containing protein [Candidatus Yonathbacteria bacterium]